MMTTTGDDAKNVIKAWTAGTVQLKKEIDITNIDKIADPVARLAEITSKYTAINSARERLAKVIETGQAGYEFICIEHGLKCSDEMLRPSAAQSAHVKWLYDELATLRRQSDTLTARSNALSEKRIITERAVKQFEEEEKKRKAAEEAAKKKREEEEAARKKAEEEEIAKKKREEEAAEKKRLEEDAAKKKKEEEDAKKQEAEEAAERKRMAEEWARKKREEEEASTAASKAKEKETMEKAEKAAPEPTEQEIDPFCAWENVPATEVKIDSSKTKDDSKKSEDKEKEPEKKETKKKAKRKRDEEDAPKKEKKEKKDKKDSKKDSKKGEKRRKEEPDTTTEFTKLVEKSLKPHASMAKKIQLAFPDHHTLVENIRKIAPSGDLWQNDERVSAKIGPDCDKGIAELCAVVTEKVVKRTAVLVKVTEGLF